MFIAAGSKERKQSIAIYTIAVHWLLPLERVVITFVNFSYNRGQAMVNVFFFTLDTIKQLLEMVIVHPSTILPRERVFWSIF